MKLTKLLMSLIALVIWASLENRRGSGEASRDKEFQPASGKPPRSPAYPVTIQLSAEDLEWHNVQTQYWDRQIRVAKGLNRITLVTMIIGIAGAIFLYLQTRTAINQLYVSQQPWVAITDVIITKPTKFHIDETIEVGFQITLKNVGQSPAAVNYIVRHVILSYSPEDARVKTRESCVGGVAFGAGTLIPGDTRTLTEFATRLGKNDIRFINGTTYMWLVGCIGYADQFGNWHSKPFTYRFNNPILATSMGIIVGDFEEFPLF